VSYKYYLIFGREIEGLFAIWVNFLVELSKYYFHVESKIYQKIIRELKSLGSQPKILRIIDMIYSQDSTDLGVQLNLSYVAKTLV
jgi:hypothetical protein